MSLNYSIIGKQIKDARRRNRLTQEALSEIIDKSSSFLSYIETGKKVLSLETFVDIANALKVSSDVLLSGNLDIGNEMQEELEPILNGCTQEEKRIIIDTAIALKKSLYDNRIDYDD